MGTKNATDQSRFALREQQQQQQQQQQRRTHPRQTAPLSLASNRRSCRPIDRRQRLFRYPRGVSRRVDYDASLSRFRAHDVRGGCFDVPGRAQHAKMQPRIVRIHHATKRVTRRRRSLTDAPTGTKTHRRHIARIENGGKTPKVGHNNTICKNYYIICGKMSPNELVSNGSTAFCWSRRLRRLSHRRGWILLLLRYRRRCLCILLLSSGRFFSDCSLLEIVDLSQRLQLLRFFAVGGIDVVQIHRTYFDFSSFSSLTQLFLLGFRCL